MFTLMSPCSVGIINYGAGNLRSVANALIEVGGNPVISSNPDELAKCDKLVLPGVGAFPHAMGILKERGIDELVRLSFKQNTPVLGICLGMQLLTHSSTEFEPTPGFCIVDAHVRALLDSSAQPDNFRTPHVGWTKIEQEVDDHWFFKGICPSSRFYFVHSFGVTEASASIIAKARYNGVEFAAALETGSAIGTQFHPEKSGPEGLKLLRNFVRQ